MRASRVGARKFAAASTPRIGRPPKRKLGDLQRELERVDLTAEKCSLGEMCDCYMATVQNEAAIATRLRADFSGGVNAALRKVPASKVAARLASYDLGPPSYNLHFGVHQGHIRSGRRGPADRQLTGGEPAGHETA